MEGEPKPRPIHMLEEHLYYSFEYNDCYILNRFPVMRGAYVLKMC